MGYKYNPFNKILSGKNIKDWVWFNSHNPTRYSSIAKGMMNLFNLYDDKTYMLTKNVEEITVTEVN